MPGYIMPLSLLVTAYGIHLNFWLILPGCWVQKRYYNYQYSNLIYTIIKIINSYILIEIYITIIYILPILEERQECSEFRKVNYSISNKWNVMEYRCANYQIGLVKHIKYQEPKLNSVFMPFLFFF